MKGRQRRAPAAFDALERELTNIIGVHVGDKLKSVHCTQGLSMVKLCCGTPFEVSDLGAPVTGLGFPAATTIVAVYSGEWAALSAPHAADAVGSPA